MTHIENVPHIRLHGITHRSLPNSNPAYVPIGDNSIIGTRAGRRLANGKLLGAYIPFYFWGRMPMLYVIQNGYNGVTATPAGDIVYCVTSVALIMSHQLHFSFTDGHAIDGLSECHSEADITAIESLLDFKAIKDRYWIDERDLDKKRRKEAEFLVETDVPTTAIIGYIVHNTAAKDKLISMGIDESHIRIRPDFYF